jgi:apolipoprotein D and lipocalin family protein
MHIIHRFILIAIVLVLNNCTSALPTNVKAINSVDANQYVGTWYEIARMDNYFERGLTQVTAKYEKLPDGTIKVTNRGYSTEKKEAKEAIGSAYFVDPPNKDGTNTGKLKVSFFKPFYAGYDIIELDKPYYNYVMVASGKDDLWILCRTPQLAYPIKQDLLAKAKALGYQVDKLIFTEQNGEVINYPVGPHIQSTP